VFLKRLFTIFKQGILKLIQVYEQMDLPNTPKSLCKLIIKGLKQKFQFELNSPIYKVIISINFFLF